MTVLDLFAWINYINSTFQNYVLLHNILSKHRLVMEDEAFPPKKKEKSGLGYAAE